VIRTSIGNAVNNSRGGQSIAGERHGETKDNEEPVREVHRDNGAEGVRVRSYEAWRSFFECVLFYRVKSRNARTNNGIPVLMLSLDVLDETHNGREARDVLSLTRMTNKSRRKGGLPGNSIKLEDIEFELRCLPHRSFSPLCPSWT
jgi:hypothetical protein